MEELHNILHEHRQSVDAVTNTIKSLRDNPVAMVCQREIALAITKLQEAKMWLGKALEESGSPFPDHLADKAGATATAQAPSSPVNTADQTQSATPVTPASQPGQTVGQAAPVEQTGDQTQNTSPDTAQQATTEQPSQ